MHLPLHCLLLATVQSLQHNCRFDSTTSLQMTFNQQQQDATTADTYRRLVQKLQSKQQQPYWIGIAGGPGSGKTTTANAICEQLNAINSNQAIVISMDGYHYSQDELRKRFGEDAMLHRGEPWTFDAELMYQQLREAQQTRCADLPVYDRGISDPVPNGVHLRPHHRYVLVEGLYVTHRKDSRWEPLCALWDEQWFVQAPTQEQQIDRLLERSLKTWSEAKAEQWGEGRDGAMKRIQTNDVPRMKLLEYCALEADEVIVTH